MPGQLFTHYFLTTGIEANPEWQSAATPLAAFRSQVAPALAALAGHQHPNEAVTEQELIHPVLNLLGWTDYLPQQGYEDIPDHLLFTDAAAKQRAVGRASVEHRYQDATVVEESKRFELALDARDTETGGQARSPHSQILRYLATADINSNGAIRWGILTNGAVWRLYNYGARPRATGYYEADLAEIIRDDDDDALHRFYLLFRRDSFIRQAGATRTFLEDALAEGRRYEEQVAQDLSSMVFERVFPNLVQALADAAGAEANLEPVREAALICLYRLLFVLYAEDRGLLPVNDARYADYGLRKPVREHIADRMQQGALFSTRAAGYYNYLLTLWRLIDEGDESIGLPPYNGGLFATAAAPLLEEVQLSDKQLAPIIYDLSHTETDGHRRFINYRDMSVQQLGSIYERLLEREPVRNDDGHITVRPNPYARKDSGSFYTPQELVDLIVARTLQPLVEERLAQFEAKAAELKSDRRPQAERTAELHDLDPAAAVLDLKVLDPAMGSGHFLVTAVDFLSDYVAELVEYVPAVPAWLPEPYVSPLVERVESIRQDILRRAQTLYLRRGQEPAGRRAGESVALAAQFHRRRAAVLPGPPPALRRIAHRPARVGCRRRAEPSGRRVRRLGPSPGRKAPPRRCKRSRRSPTPTLPRSANSALLFRGVEDTTEDLRGLLDFLSGLSWLTAGMKKKEQAAFQAPLGEALGKHHRRLHPPRPRAGRCTACCSPLSPRERGRGRGAVPAVPPAGRGGQGQPSSGYGATPSPPPTASTSSTGKSPSPASGTAGSTRSPKAASTP